MKLKAFVVIICVQVVVIIVLFLQIRHKNKNVLGISINTIDSKTIEKIQGREYKNFYEPKPNIINEPLQWSPYKAVYTINKDSLNERYDYQVEKERGVFRIITLGDSFTYGLFVDTKNNWTELLEDYLNKKDTCLNINKVEVINLGMQGYDIGYATERYRKRGIKYHPDLILWLIIEPQRITEEILTKIAINKKNWISEGANEHSYDIWARAYSEVLNEFPSKEMNIYQFSMLSKIGKIYNGPIIFLLQQNRFEFQEPSYIYTYAQERANTQIHQTINIWEDNNFHFQTDLHPNVEGHKAIAKDVYEFLTKNNLIPCTQQTSQ